MKTIGSQSNKKFATGGELRRGSLAAGIFLKSDKSAHNVREFLGPRESEKQSLMNPSSAEAKKNQSVVLEEDYGDDEDGSKKGRKGSLDSENI